MPARSHPGARHTRVRLKSFNGAAVAPPDQDPAENYWLLIGAEGLVVEPRNQKGRLLIQFDVSVSSLGLQSHNPVPNTLLILASDLDFLE